MKLSPSILSANFAKLSDDIKKVEQAGGVDLLHVDVMDGNFVPNISIGIPVLTALRQEFPTMIMDVHLMIDKPERYIDDFVKAGADIISIHAESTNHLERVVKQIKEHNIKASIALNPATPLCVLDYVLEHLDMVLIMTVNPGFGGQKFIPQMLHKISELKQTITQKGLNIEIQIDGGATPSNIYDITKAGADIVVAGSAVFCSKDIPATIKDFHQNSYK